MENLTANLNGSTSTDWVENLATGEELFFVDAHCISDPKWMRHPCMKKGDALELTAYYLTHPDFKDVNMFSDHFLNEMTRVYDDDDGWVDGWTTNRENIFGYRYQNIYEKWCNRAGVNKDLVEKFQRLRAEKEEELGLKTA